MASWNTVTLSDSTKSFAWKGVMKEFKEDTSVPSYARALIELLVEERRELLETQQKMLKTIGNMERKVNDLVSIQSSSKSGQSSSNQTPVNSDSSNEATLPPSVGVDLSRLLDSQPTTRVEITTGEPLFYDSFPTSSLMLPKMEGVDDEDVDDYEGYGKSELNRLAEGVVKAINNNQKDSSSAPNSGKRKRPHSSGDGNSLPGVPSILDHYCRFTDCDESFETAADLEEHVRRHTYKQKHHCSVCGLGIRSETRLRDHMNQHTGERPYVCEFCGKGFTRVDAKNGHLKKCTEREKRTLEDLQQLIGTTSAMIDNDDEMY